MQNIILMGAANIDEFTGRDHSRLLVLLAVLAAASVLLWVMVCLSIVARQGTIVILRILRYISRHRTSDPRGAAKGD